MKTVPMILSGWTTPNYGTKTSIKIPGGPKLHEAIIRTNLIASQILWAVLKVGTDTIYRVKGSDLVMEERYRERYETAPGNGTQTTAVNEFVMNFADIANLGVTSRDYTALVTMPGENITLELELGAGVGGTPPDILLELHLEVSDNDPRGRRFLPRRLRGVFNASLLQDNRLSLDKNANLYYRRIHLESADISKVRISKDKATVYERTRERNFAHLLRNDRAPQPNYHHLDFIASDFGLQDPLQGNAATELDLIFNIDSVDNALEYLLDTVEDLHPEWGAVSS